MAYYYVYLPGGQRMRTWRGLIVMIVLSSLAIACSKKQETAAGAPRGEEQQAIAQAPAPGGETPKAGAMLAYEHSIYIELPSAEMPERLAAAREACDTGRFGVCNILRIEQDSRDKDSQLVMRLVPAGVEPLVKLAAQNGKITRRQTRADDLTDAVQDNRRKLALIDEFAKRLEELVRHKDMAASDLIELSRQRAQLQIDRESLQNAAAQYQRRIDTNLLTINFTTTSSHQLINGISDAFSAFAYCIPYLLLAFLIALAWRWIWRRGTRSRKNES